MSARDDFGSMAGRPGGYNDRAGGLGNGGIGGGMHSGSMGGGAGRNGGTGSDTGLSTGNKWHGNTAWGRPGGSVQGYGTRRPNGQMVDPRRPDGSRPVISSAISQAAPPVRPAGAPPPAVAQPPVGMPPPRQPSVQGWLPSWPGTGQWWGDQPRYNNTPGLSGGTSPYTEDYNEPNRAWGYNPPQLGIGPNSPGNTQMQNGNTVNQNNQGTFRSGLHGGGGR